MQYNDRYDGHNGYDSYYESQWSNAAAEAEQEAEYQYYLDGLLKDGKTALFAAHIALDWMQSKEFSESGLTAVEFLVEKIESFRNQSAGKF